MAGAAFGHDRAPMLFENTATDRESEPGTAGPGAEAGIKDAGQVAGGNARSGVAQRDFYAVNAARVIAGRVVVPRFRAGTEVDTTNREPAAAGHEAKGIEREVEQHLLEAVTVSVKDDAVEAVDDLHFDPRLLGEGQKKVVGPVEQLSRIGGSEFGLRRVVQVQHIVDGRGQRAQASLDVFDPTAAFAFKVGLGQKSCKKFEAAERVADFVREQSRHFDQSLLAAELFAVVFEFFCLADIPQNENRSSTVVILLQPRMAQRNPYGFGWR